MNSLRGRGVLREGVPDHRLTGGTVNSAWRVPLAAGGEAVLRVGPAQDTVAAGPSWLRGEALACEAIVVDRVRRAVPVPVTLSAGFVGRPWLLQSMIPGRPLVEVLPAMEAAARAAIWREIGSLLRGLHGIGGGWFGTPDGRHRYPDWPSMVWADVEGLHADACRLGLDPAPFARLRAEVAASGAVLGQVARPVVVHSDLDPRHVFVQVGDGASKLTGVIDWEYARFVDPWSESLLVAMLARPERDPDRTALLAGYGADPVILHDPAFQQRQAIYRGIADGWARTDVARR